MSNINDLGRRLQEIQQRLNNIHEAFKGVSKEGEQLNIDFTPLKSGLEYVDKLLSAWERSSGDLSSAISRDADQMATSITEVASAYEKALRAIETLKGQIVPGAGAGSVEDIRSSLISGRLRLGKSYETEIGGESRIIQQIIDASTGKFTGSRLEQQGQDFATFAAEAQKFLEPLREIKILSPDIAEDIKRMSESVKEFSEAYPGSSASNLLTVFDDITRRLKITSTAADALQKVFSDLFQEFEKIVQSPAPTDKVEAYREFLSTLAPDVQSAMISQGQLRGFKGSPILERGQGEGGVLNAKIVGDWEQAVRKLGNEFDTSAENVERLVQHIGEYLQSVGRGYEEVRVLSTELDGLTGRYKVLIETVDRAGNVITDFSGRVEVDAATGEVRAGFRSGQQFEGRAQGDWVRENLDYVRQIYSTARGQLETEVSNLLEQEGIRGVELAKTQINEFTGEIELLINYIRQLGDGTEKTESIFRRFGTTIEEGVMRVTAPEDPAVARLQGISNQFSPGGRERFTANLFESMGDTFQIEHIRGAYHDVASGLIRVQLAAESTSGVMSNLNLTFDRQGRLVDDTSTRYKGFSEALNEAVARVLRYAIAANLVYSAINQLRELPGVLADLDQSLSRISTMTPLTREQTGRFFDSAVQLAKEYNFELQEVLQTSEKALQVSGQGGTEQALILMGDALLYAKISGQALTTSLDTMLASLNQTGMALTEGRELLESWIVLSRQLGVDLQSFATVYASVGSLATQVLSSDVDEAIDQFNAMISVMELSTGMSDDQLSSFFKTSFASFASPEVIKSLQNYGIEVKDAAGNTRDLYDVFEEIYALTVQYGAATPGALTAISSLLGRGGARQAAQVTTLIQEWGKVKTATEISREAAVDYDAFMEELLTNLSSNMTSLQNSFQSLLMSLGDAGLTSLLSNLTGVIEKLVNVFDNFDESLGSTSVQLLILLPALLKVRSAIASLASRELEEGVTLFSGQGIFRNFGAYMDASKIPLGETENWAYALAAGITTSLTAALSGDEAGMAISRGLASAIAMGLGTAVGGPVVGVAVAQMVQVLFSLIQTEMEKYDLLRTLYEDQDLSGLVSESRAGEILRRDVLGTGERRSLEALAATALRATDTPGGRPTGQLLMQRAEELAATAGPLQEAAQLYLNLQVELSEQEKMEAEAEVEALAERLTTNLTAERFSKISFGFDSFTDYTQSEEYLRGIERLQETAFRRFAIDQTLSRRDYSAITEPGGALFTTAPNMAKAAWDNFGESVEGVSGSFQDLEMNFHDVIELFAFTGEMSSFVGGEVSKLSQMKTATIEGTVSVEEYREEWERVWILIQLLSDELERSIASGLSMPGFIDWRDTTPDQRAAAIRNARVYQDAFADTLGWMEDEYEAWQNQLDPLYLRIDDAEFEELSEGIAQWALQLGMEASKAFDEGFNIRRLKDLSPDMWSEFERLNRYWVEYIARARGTDSASLLESEGETFNFVLGEGNELRSILSVGEAINFVLQDILEVEQKQLEGMWNIPDGATFWVPLTSLFYQNQGGAGVPTLPEVAQLEKAGEDLSGSSVQLNESGDRLKSAAEVFMDLATFRWGEAEADLGPRPDASDVGAAWKSSEMTPELIWEWLKRGSRGTEGPFRDTVAEREARLSDLEEGPFTSEATEAILRLSDAIQDRFPSQRQQTSPMMDFLQSPLESLKEMFLNLTERFSPLSSADTVPTGLTEVTVNVPEPSKIDVESSVNVQLIMNERVIAQVVQRYLAREAKRTIKERTITATIGRV